MQPIVIWQLNGESPENGDRLAQIRHWWSNLTQQKILWQQRVRPANTNILELDWDRQRFDEEFVMASPELRGITLYWRKSPTDAERSTTPAKLALDQDRQKLYIFPQSQPDLVLRVGSPDIIYQKYELKDPQVSAIAAGENKLLTLRDPQQQIEVKITLSPTTLDQLAEQLNFNS